MSSMRYTSGLAAAALSIIAGQAAAQSVDFGVEFGTPFTNATSSVVSVPAGGTGDQTLTLFHAAGYTATPGGPNLQVQVDGTIVATFAAGQTCTNTLTETITIPDSVYTAAAADGSITLDFIAVGTTGTGTLCTGVNAFTAPLDTVPPPALAVLATSGSLTTSGAPTIPDASAQQASFALARGAMILANGPGYERRLYRVTGTGAVSRGLSFEGTQILADTAVQLDVGRNALNFSTAPGGAFWAEGTYTRLDDDATSDQDFGVLHAGADFLVSEGVLLGLGIQYDTLGSTDTASGDTFDGAGWMVGPYVTARLAPNLFIDARIAYGEVDTDIDRAGGAGRDSYSSDRTLAEVALIGDQSYGAYVIEPRAELAWYKETADAYTSITLGQVGETEVEIGQAVFGGRVIRPSGFAGGQLTPYVDLSAAYTYYETGTAASGTFADAFEGWSGSLGLGIAFNGRGGSEWTVDATFTGAGSGANATALRAGVTIPF